MKRRSIILIIWLAYLVAVILLYTVVPFVDPSVGGLAGYLPFFFFLPIFFPRRLMRSGSNQKSANNKTNSNGGTGPDNSNEYSGTPMSDGQSFDQYGISYRRRNFNFIYLAGIVIILVAAFIAIYVFVLK